MTRDFLRIDGKTYQSRARTFAVGAGDDQEILVPVASTIASIRTAYEPEPGTALYITGQGSLLGNW